jgi:hypothetical protein
MYMTDCWRSYEYSPPGWLCQGNTFKTPAVVVVKKQRDAHLRAQRLTNQPDSSTLPAIHNL